MESSSQFLGFAHRLLQNGGLEPHEYDHSQKNPISTMFICLFGATVLLVVCNLARTHQVGLRIQAEEQEQRAREEAQQEAKAADMHKRAWMGLMKRNQVSKVLDATDFRVGDPSGAFHVDIEMGNATTPDADRSGEEDVSRTAGDLAEDDVPLDTAKEGSNTESVLEEDVEQGAIITQEDEKDVVDPNLQATVAVEKHEDEQDENPVGTMPSTTVGDSDETNLRALPSPQDCNEIVLPRDEEDDDDDTPQQTVPNLCAICLDTYSPGERIIWSNNPKCLHAFHDDCLMDYYVSKLQKEESNPNCPCCRQVFFIKKKNAWKKKKTSSGL